MIYKRDKNIFKRILYNPKFLAFIGLSIIILISFPLSKNISKKYKIDQEIKELEREISDIEYKNNDFKKLIAYLESDQFVEEQARLNLGLKKHGEEAVIIKEKNETINFEISELIKGKADSESLNYSNPRRWRNYFFNE